MSAIMYLISMKGYNDQHKKENVTIISKNDKQNLDMCFTIFHMARLNILIYSLYSSTIFFSDFDIFLFCYGFIPGYLEKPKLSL